MKDTPLEELKKQKAAKSNPQWAHSVIAETTYCAIF
jgi:hypothetical protein